MTCFAVFKIGKASEAARAASRLAFQHSITVPPGVFCTPMCGTTKTARPVESATVSGRSEGAGKTVVALGSFWLTITRSAYRARAISVPSAEPSTAAPFAGDFLAFDGLGEGGGRRSLAGLHVLLVVIQEQIHAALHEGGRLERRARMQRDEMRVETLGQADGYVEPRGDQLTGIAMNQDRLVSHRGLRITLEATYEIKTPSGLIWIKLPYPLDHIMPK
jgi:hypothetical protein